MPFSSVILEVCGEFQTQKNVVRQASEKLVLVKENV